MRLLFNPSKHDVWFHLCHSLCNKWVMFKVTCRMIYINALKQYETYELLRTPLRPRVLEPTIAKIIIIKKIEMSLRSSSGMAFPDTIKLLKGHLLFHFRNRISHYCFELIQQRARTLHTNLNLSKACVNKISLYRDENGSWKPIPSLTQRLQVGIWLLGKLSSLWYIAARYTMVLMN